MDSKGRKTRNDDHTMKIHKVKDKQTNKQTPTKKIQLNCSMRTKVSRHTVGQHILTKCINLLS